MATLQVYIVHDATTVRNGRMRVDAVTIDNQLAHLYFDGNEVNEEKLRLHEILLICKASVKSSVDDNIIVNLTSNTKVSKNITVLGLVIDK